VLSFGLSLLGIGKSIMAWLSAAFGWLFKRWYRVAIAALCVVVMVLTFVNISLRGQVAHWRERYTVEATAHIKTRVNYANAQKVAADMNKKQVEVTENKRKEIANAKDAEIRSSIDRAVADARRVWAAKATKGFARGSSASEVATGPVDPNGTSGMSVLDESDVQICTINTLKAKGWQDFYEGLRASE
jgi:hypothetical protein